MRWTGILMLLFVISVPVFGGEAPFQIGLAASVGLDWYSGARLNSSRFREANPVMGQSRFSQAVVIGATAAVSMDLTHRLYKSGKRKTAIILMLSVTAVHGFAAYHNFKIGRGR